MKRILILGGGFGGVYTALTLEKLLKAELDRGEVELGLVSRDNYIVFQPMLPEVISGSIGIVDTITPIRRLCPRTNLYTRTIESIDLEHRRVVAAAGFGSQQLHLEYDHLVIALGNVTTFAGQSGLAEHALPFKYLGDALVLRNHAIHVLEEADIERDPEMRRSLLTFVVAGGGFSGVEAVAELNDFVRAAAKSFRNVRPEEIRVRAAALGRAHPARAAGEPRGVRAAPAHEAGRRAAPSDPPCRRHGGRGAPVGRRAHRRPARWSARCRRGPTRSWRRCAVAWTAAGSSTDAHLELPEYPGVWAVGDCALIIDAKTGRAEPAHGAARHAGGALRGREHRGDPARHGPVARSRSRRWARWARSATARPSPRSSASSCPGFLAWWLWRTIYLMKLPGLDRKIRVAVDWTLDLLLPPDIVQLRTERSAGIRREHFEPGEVIFQEGDHGDWLYIVVDGEVEVLKRVPGQGDATLRRLGPGDCFGEIALLGDHIRTATTRSLTAVNVLAVDRDAFQALFSTLPPLRIFFERLIEDRMGPMASHHAEGEVVADARPVAPAPVG